jgi:hypothetical protein
MRINRSIKVVVIAILCFTSGCSPVSSHPTASIPVPNPTNASQVTASLILKAPTMEEPTGTPSSPELLDAGPWLLSYPGMFFSNLDGSALTRLELPKTDRYYWASWTGPSVLLGGLVAVEVFRSENEAELWIIKLPELRVKKIALLGEQARQTIEEYNKNDPTQEMMSPVMRSLMYQNLIWSPDGRYLAFAGALDGPSADVYVYDRIEDAVRRLSSGPAQSQILGWSPDSHWIINASTEVPSSYVSYVWANSVQGDRIVKLYQSNGGEAFIFGWVSNNTFIVVSNAFETPFWGLKEVNADSGNVYPLYSSWFTEAAFDPRTVTLILDIGPFMFSKPDLPSGLYRQVIGEGQPQMLIPGEDFHMLQWNQSISQFSVNMANDHLLTFDSHGKSGPGFQNATTLIPSPDGNWILTLGKDLKLYDRIGNQIATLGPASSAMWLADSSGFVRWKCDCDTNEFFLHLMKDEWQAVITKKLEDIQESASIFSIVSP